MLTRYQHTYPFEVSGRSDVGQVREQNQDHFLIADLRRQLRIRDTDVPLANDPEMYGKQQGQLLVVADGMGGRSGGEVASRIAVQATADYVLDMMHWFLKLSPDTEEEFLHELKKSLGAIQQRIWTESPEPGKPMGTTVTMAYVVWPRAYIVHAGDSRCYLFRGNHLVQLTTDHTIAQQLVDSGQIEPENPNLKRWRHILWNCVGGDQQVQPEAVRCSLQPGDQLLLCSDGLTGMLKDSDIQQILASSETNKDKANQLIEAANLAGGKDNITAIVAAFDQHPEETVTAVRSES